MMNKDTYARAYGLVLAITFAILIADLVLGVWPRLRGALFLAISILMATGVYIVGLWIMSYRMNELKRKLPISGAERRRKNREFYDWLRSQGRR
jgi:hypothetical protein